MKRNLVVVHLIFICLSSLLFFVSCSKDGSSSGVTVTLPEPTYCDTSGSELDAWYFFKTGSYWKYRDTLTGIHDSIYVIDHEYFDTDDVSNWTFVAYSTFHDEYYRWNTPAGGHPKSCTTNPDCYCPIIVKKRFNSGGSYWIRNAFVYPVNEGEQCQVLYYSNYDNFSRCTEIIPTMVLNGVEYHNVAKWELPQDPLVYGWPTVHYTVKNVGIICYEWPSIGRRWELLSYQVFQN